MDPPQAGIEGPCGSVDARRDGALANAKTVAWIIAVLIFPVVGTIVYFLVNGAGVGEGPPRDEIRPAPRRF
jgi:Phospholipase_D-nuclease N-terminal